MATSLSSCQAASFVPPSLDERKIRWQATLKKDLNGFTILKTQHLFLEFVAVCKQTKYAQRIKFVENNLASLHKITVKLQGAFASMEPSAITALIFPFEYLRNAVPKSYQAFHEEIAKRTQNGQLDETWDSVSMLIGIRKSWPVWERLVEKHINHFNPKNILAMLKVRLAYQREPCSEKQIALFIALEARLDLSLINEKDSAAILTFHFIHQIPNEEFFARLARDGKMIAGLKIAVDGHLKRSLFDHLHLFFVAYKGYFSLDLALEYLEFFCNKGWPMVCDGLAPFLYELRGILMEHAHRLEAHEAQDVLEHLYKLELEYLDFVEACSENELVFISLLNCLPDHVLQSFEESDAWDFSITNLDVGFNPRRFLTILAKVDIFKGKVPLEDVSEHLNSLIATYIERHLSFGFQESIRFFTSMAGNYEYLSKQAKDHLIPRATSLFAEQIIKEESVMNFSLLSQFFQMHRRLREAFQSDFFSLANVGMNILLLEVRTLLCKRYSYDSLQQFQSKEESTKRARVKLEKVNNALSEIADSLYSPIERTQFPKEEAELIKAARLKAIDHLASLSDQIDEIDHLASLSDQIDEAEETSLKLLPAPGGENL